MPPQAPNLGPPSGVAGVNVRSTFTPGQTEDAVPSSNSPSLRGGAQIVNSTHALLDDDVIAWFGSFPIRESSRCTDMLSGATFTQAESGEHHGRPATMFIFFDLAVQSEGTFVLRYRVAEMDVHPSQPLLFSTVAECYGEPFKISSAGEHSGRRASESNPVAQHLALHGISVKTLQDEPHGYERVSTPKGPLHSSGAPSATAHISARL
ncbi:uncharacterized protein TRAVEDRAFT_58661 [Trametes versicolor FP-101664 SS1]|uniref:uncharacterized protein n=1 Tax=Trametes versicolor (strain FP-101664) TaxID=717944 RepID=UPI0004623294|nr:uncharacterized protein TRAVEDRAFT_58661 [Trametes versicolor FP-101664 SS1]EIW58378.1 hypothetical protein TRAVEDRAFT_58661 [Trametes versicolor FP-101664 SS1]